MDIENIALLEFLLVLTMLIAKFNTRLSILKLFQRFTVSHCKR